MYVTAKNSSKQIVLCVLKVEHTFAFLRHSHCTIALVVSKTEALKAYLARSTCIEWFLILLNAMNLFYITRDLPTVVGDGQAQPAFSTN